MLLVLDCIANVVVMLDIDQALEIVPFGEPFNQAFLMLPNTLGKIACNSDMESTVASVGHDVNTRV
jgi:hypothetical protein